MPIGVGFSVFHQARPTPPARLTAEQQRLAIEHKPLAYRFARHLVSRRWKPALLLKDDLESVASLAVVVAAMRFDANKGAFAALLYCVVRGEIARAAQNAEAVRMPSDSRCKPRRTVTNSAFLGGRITDLDELDKVIQREQRDQVRTALAKLPARQQKILLAHADGASLREIGRMVAISKERVRQILKSEMAKMREHLAG